MSQQQWLALQSFGFLVVVLLTSPAQAQEQTLPLNAPAQVGPQSNGAMTVVITQAPPVGYAPVQIIEVPGVYGASYGQQVPNARIGALQLELASVESQYSQYSLGLPIGLIIAGGITTGVAGLFCLTFWAVDSFESTPESSRGLLISGIVTVIGAVALVGGIVTLISRISARRPIGRRIKEIRRELASYGVSASLDLSAAPSGAVVVGTLSF